MQLDQCFEDTFRSLTLFATTFEMDHGVLFVEANTTDFAQDFLVSNGFPDASPDSYMRPVRLTRFVLRKPLRF